MAKIIIGNVNCQIVDETDTRFLRKLDDLLSYEIPGAQYSAAYKGFFNKEGKFVKWDGKKRLMSDKLVFAYGLMEKVCDFYKSNNKEFTLEDKRPSKTSINTIDISEKLKEINKIPYPHQIEALEAVKKHDRGIIHVVTSGGKTLIAALITAYYGKPTIVHVISADLMYQFYDFFVQIFGAEKVGMVGNGECKISLFTIMSIWTEAQVFGLSKKELMKSSEDMEEEKNINKNKYVEIAKCIKNSKISIYDECHFLSAETFHKVHSISAPEMNFGLSGTPWRTDRTDLLIECIVGKTICKITASDLISKNLITKPIIRFIDCPPYHEKIEKNYQTIYSKYIVENEIRNNLIVKHAKELISKGYKLLILFRKINHGKILLDLLSKEIKCELLDGRDDLDKRLEIKNKMNNGEIDAIVASKIFSTGLDLPILSAVINCGSGKSTSMCHQILGRVLRLYPGKKHAIMIDFVDNAVYLKEHSKARYNTLAIESEFNLWASKTSGFKRK